MTLSEILDITNIPEKDKPIDITLSGPENIFELDFSKLSNDTLSGLDDIIDKSMKNHDYISNKKMLEKELPDFSESQFNTRNGYATYDEKTGKDTTGHFSKSGIIGFLTNKNTKNEMMKLKTILSDITWSKILFGELFFSEGISTDTVNDFITSIGLQELTKFTKHIYKTYFTDEQKAKYPLSEEGTIKIKGKNILLTPLHWLEDKKDNSYKKIKIKITSCKLRWFSQSLLQSWSTCDFISQASKTIVLKKILHSFDWEENYNGQTLKQMQKIIKEKLPKSEDSKRLKLFLAPETVEVLNAWINDLSSR